jgi:hypothetical protein
MVWNGEKRLRKEQDHHHVGDGEGLTYVCRIGERAVHSRPGAMYDWACDEAVCAAGLRAEEGGMSGMSGTARSAEDGRIGTVDVAG